MAPLALLPEFTGEPLDSAQIENDRQFKIALEPLATFTTADLVMFIVVSVVARVFHSIPVDWPWSLLK